MQQQYIHFHYSPPRDRSSGEFTFSFFPVNNKLSRKDPAVLSMLKVVEEIIGKSDYVHAERQPTRKWRKLPVNAR